jgi:preprotein translocase subunit SecA
MQGQIVLSTPSYGRGTDFICRDKKLKALGPHVIIAYWPLSESELVQLKGRTARQSQHGSF